MEKSNDFFDFLVNSTVDIISRWNHEEASQGEIVALPGLLREIREFYQSLPSSHTDYEARYKPLEECQQQTSDSSLVTLLTRRLSETQLEKYPASQKLFDGYLSSHVTSSHDHDFNTQ